MSVASLANPTGGEVVSGSGTIVHTSSTRMDIEQGSERLGLEWQDFSIGNGEQVNFDQPSRNAIALNRVTGSKASDIRGLLTANGNVFVVNRNGVIFHRSAQVDVGGLLATTSDISNADFMAGRYRFDRNVNPNGRVVNEGRITAAEGGLVALVAPSVRNAGVIGARLGKVVMGSGSRFTLDLYGDDLVGFAVDDQVAAHLKGLDGEAVSSRVDESGTIDAPGGRVWLTASAAKAVVDGAINLSGVVRAQTVSQEAGHIVLSGSGPGLVKVSGQVDATGDGPHQGGRIEVLGEQVAIEGTVDASGGAGGGTVLVGGDYQGRGKLRRSSETTVAAGSALRADATHSGDGGTVVVWSDRHTQVAGTVSARGGPGGGDGGLVETSSAGRLDFTTSAKVDAPLGEAGTWLLDPEDITIGRGEADSIEATLNEGGNVSIQTSASGDGEGNIAVEASITKSDGGDASLSMTAHNRIDVDAPITSQAGKLAVSLEAGTAVNVNAAVETNGGGFTSHVTGIAPDTSSDTTDSTTATTTATTTDTSTGSDSGSTDAASGDATDSGTTTSTDTGSGTSISSDTGSTDTTSADTSSTTSDTTDSGSGTGTSTDSNTDGGSTADTTTVTRSVDSTTQVASSSAQDTSYVVVQDTVSTHGGDISVDAGDTGAALVTGTLDSSNTDAGRTGGDIEVLGRDVVLAGDAVVDASGDSGGGDINIGGDYQGKGERRQSRTTTVGRNVTIRSDATGEGDGGDVVVWSKGTTRFSGKISARGGPNGGDGGDVEVSGKQNLGFWGTVDAGAPNGSGGSLLLDPDHLTIIDAKRGQGDEDLNVLCDSIDQTCWLPSDRFLPPPGVTEDLANQYIFPEEFAALGIDPYGDTPLNTLSWGRLKQLLQVTGFGIKLEADNDIVFKAFNGTVSTRGSPTGSRHGKTITLVLSDPTRIRNNLNLLSVLSHHGDIVFENQKNNLAAYGGFMSFSAPEGELHLGNLYGLGPVEQVTDRDTSWRFGAITLEAGGDIEVGTINTRNDPARFADPGTGVPQPQVLVVPDPSDFDLSLLDDPALRSDSYRGGPISITSTGGNIHILRPVYTGTGDFFAQAAGTFTATHIDTGANHVIIKASNTDTGRHDTLNTGIVDITGDRIAFDQINAGQVSLNALSYAPDAITGTVVFDTYVYASSTASLSFDPGRLPTEPGMKLTVGDTPTIDLLFAVGQLGQATAQNLNTGTVLDDANDQLSLNGTVLANLGADFNFTGGDLLTDKIYVPHQLVLLPFGIVSPPGVIPIAVPLDLPQSTSTLAVIGFSSGSTAVVGGGPSLLPVTGNPLSQPATTNGSEITFSSSADADRIKSQGKEKQDDDTSGECPADDRFEWLRHGARSTAREVDWGQQPGIGTGPEDTKNVFKSGTC